MTNGRRPGQPLSAEYFALSPVLVPLTHAMTDCKIVPILLRYYGTLPRMKYPKCFDQHAQLPSFPFSREFVAYMEILSGKHTFGDV